MKSVAGKAALIALVVAGGLAGCGDITPNGNAQKPQAPTSDVPSIPSLKHDREARIESNGAPRDTPPAAEPTTKPPEPQPVFRPDDQRPKHDDQKLADLGIKRYESQRLILYTDIDPQIAATLPPVIDQAYQALVDYFGPLAPDRSQTEFQMTGYLIKSDALFREAVLIPEDLPAFEHGRHRRNEFWMREQKYDYYRRHLLIHEATHCFMTVMPDVEAPVWYMEGMAEYFGTHRLQADGRATFREMPTTREEFAGMGRITLIRNEFAAGRARTIPAIQELVANDFLTGEPYAWSWALCLFLDTHPRYQARFRGLKAFLQRNAFPAQFLSEFQRDFRDLAIEWQLFVQNLQYGYDTARAAIDFQPGTSLSEQSSMRQCSIRTDRGWQSSGVLVEEGKSYEVTATGQFELASQPKPWISEPQGISFRYFNGLPLGMVVACVCKETGDTSSDLQIMRTVLHIGRHATITAPVTGTMYLRVNDEWNSLADNRGEVTIEIRGAQDK